MTGENLAAFVAESARRRPGAVAASMHGRDLTYSELLDGVAETAGGLRAAGVGRGDRVLAFAENSPQYLAAFLATARLGAIFTTVYPSFQEDELGYILANSRPRIALVADSLRARFDGPARTWGESIGIFRLDDFGTGDLPAGDPVMDDVRVDARDGVLISYTSGSTNRPKPVFHAHQGLIDATRAHRAVWGFGERDVVLLAVPVAWLYGSVTTSMTALSAGARLAVMPHFNPLRALELIDSEAVTVFQGVGTMFVKVLQAAEEHDVRADTSSLRLCLAGGEARNEEALERFRRRFGRPVHDVYAMSECFPLVTYDPVADPLPVAGSAGRVVPGADVRLLGPSGEEVGPGEVGELYARCPASMIEYYGEPEMTANAVDPDGWYRTRDLCRIDDRGYVFVVGRASDMIIRGGANVSPAEVERVLCEHPAVVEAAVVGRPDRTYGEQVVAFVVAREGVPTTDELTAHCAARLASYKVPSTIEVLDELPRTATGKVAKTQLPVAGAEAAARG